MPCNILGSKEQNLDLAIWDVMRSKCRAHFDRTSARLLVAIADVTTANVLSEWSGFAEHYFLVWQLLVQATGPTFEYIQAHWSICLIWSAFSRQEIMSECIWATYYWCKMFEMSTHFEMFKQNVNTVNAI